jgi:peptidoglycan/xylan/chitin deacetylase (PgdA/CDA1 family)
MRAAIKNAFDGHQRRWLRLRTRLRAPKAAADGRLTIFVLHAVSNAPSDMAVSAECLREQLSALLENGYRCLDFEEVVRVVTGAQLLTTSAFALTFDDGYRNLYEQAWPILDEFGLTAVLFVTEGFLNGRVTPPWGATHPDLVREYTALASHFQPLEWSQLRQMIDSGRFRLGSHSIHHQLLGLLHHKQVEEEIRGSRQILEDRLGMPVRYFSYPYGVQRHGAYSDKTEEMVRVAGYVSSCTSEIGRAGFGSGAYLVPRIPLVSEDSGKDACAKAAGYYDWVGLAQRIFQRLSPNPHNR